MACGFGAPAGSDESKGSSSMGRGAKSTRGSGSVGGDEAAIPGRPVPRRTRPGKPHGGRHEGASAVLDDRHQWVVPPAPLGKARKGANDDQRVRGAVVELPYPARVERGSPALVVNGNIAAEGKELDARVRVL